MPGMAGFSTEERKLVAGTILGLRSWQITKENTLRSVATRYVWTEGDQVGTCDTDWCEAAAEEIAHDVASLDSDCGFYAYTAGGNNHYQPPVRCECSMCKSAVTWDPANYSGIGTMAGVIEAWGRVTVGSLGFRAENARIVALGGGLAPRYYDGNEYTTPLEAMDVSKTLALYPSVPYFSDVQAMAREFGLSEIEEVN